MSENFASFYRKASSVRELVGKAPFPEKARFQITKVIELPANQYRRYMNELLRDVSFISRNVTDMRFDGKTETFLCLLVTCRDANTGLLVESEGFGYARYAAFIPEKSALSLDGIPTERASEECLAGIRLRRDDFFFYEEAGSARPILQLPYRLKTKPRAAGRKPTPPMAALAQA